MSLNIFPSKEMKFTLYEGREATLERLQRRTATAEHLLSSIADRSFKGVITRNQFKIINATLGRGGLCIMTGEIYETTGIVKVTIHKAFKILLFVLLSLVFYC